MSDRTVLLVEDNLGDVRLIETAFEDRDLPGTLHVASSTPEALDRVRRRGEFESTPRPDVLLVDLNLTGASGHEVVSEVKSDDELKHLPVVVLTGSKSDDDLRAAYEEHANAYLRKPVDPEAFADLLETFAEFWLSAAVLPTAADADDEPDR